MVDAGQPKVSVISGLDSARQPIEAMATGRMVMISAGATRRHPTRKPPRKYSVTCSARKKRAAFGVEKPCPRRRSHRLKPAATNHSPTTSDGRRNVAKNMVTT